MTKPRLHFFLILVHCLGGHAGIVLWITLKRHFYDAILQSYHMRWRFANRSPPSGITTISSFRNSVLYLPYQNSSTSILYWNGNAFTSLPILHSWHNLNCFTSSTYICVWCKWQIAFIVNSAFNPSLPHICYLGVYKEWVYVYLGGCFNLLSLWTSLYISKAHRYLSLCVSAMLKKAVSDQRLLCMLCMYSIGK